MDISMGWPEWILVSILAIGMIKDACRANGWRPEERHCGNAFYAFRILFKPAVWGLLLYLGGFFS